MIQFPWLNLVPSTSIHTKLLIEEEKMKISTQHRWLIIETTFTVIVGLVHTGAGIVLSYLCLLGHIYYDHHVPPSQPTTITRMQKQQTKSRQLPPINEKS